jgi:hypothetical protein
MTEKNVFPDKIAGNIGDAVRKYILITEDIKVPEAW